MDRSISAAAPEVEARPTWPLTSKAAIGQRGGAALNATGLASTGEWSRPQFPARGLLAGTSDLPDQPVATGVAAGSWLTPSRAPRMRTTTTPDVGPSSDPGMASFDYSDSKGVASNWNPTPGPTPGGDPLPTVRITSRGKNDDDATATPPPDVLQGMGYTLQFSGLTPQAPENPGGGPPAFEYRIEKYGATYPTGVVKGYGYFAAISGDPDGPHTVFAGGPTGATNPFDDPNRYVRVDSVFTADDRDIGFRQRDAQGQLVDRFIDTFYWGPESEGPKSVSVKAYFRKFEGGVDKGVVTATDTVTLNVLKPTGSITRVHLGTAGLSPAQTDGSRWLALDKGIDQSTTGNNAITLYDRDPIGIRWAASVQLPRNRTEGAFGVVQLITMGGERLFAGAAGPVSWVPVIPLFERLPNGGSRPLLDPQGRTVALPAEGMLDAPSQTTYPDEFLYGNTFKQIGTTRTLSTTAGIGAVLKGSDNPGLSLVDRLGGDAISTRYRNDFVNTLLYNPLASPDKSNPQYPATIWVPVAELTWDWSAAASYSATANPKWTQTAASQRADATSRAAQTNGDFPNWEHEGNEVGAFRRADQVVMKS